MKKILAVAVTFAAVAGLSSAPAFAQGSGDEPPNVGELTPVVSMTTECGVLNVHLGVRGDKDAEGILYFGVFADDERDDSEIYVGEPDEVVTFSLEGHVHVIVYAGGPGDDWEDPIFDEVVTVECTEGNTDLPPEPDKVLPPVVGPSVDGPPVTLLPDPSVLEPILPATNPVTLPVTGQDLTVFVLIAAALLLLGGYALFITRRLSGDE